MLSNTIIRESDTKVLPDSKAEAETDLELQLEESTGEKALAWVKQRNEVTAATFTHSSLFKKLHAEVLSCEQDNHRTYHEGYLYEFLQHEKHAQGIWRRISLEEYKKNNGSWELLLDLDALLEEEQWKALTNSKNHTLKTKENWVFKGALHCPQSSRVLVMLSLGDGKSLVFREFDVETKSFIKDGFDIAEGRLSSSNVRWCDSDSLWISTCVYEQDLVKPSAWYYRVFHLPRGEPLRNAKRTYESCEDQIHIKSYHDLTTSYVVARISVKHKDIQSILIDNKNFSGAYIPMPHDARVKGIIENQIIIVLHKDWKINDDLTYKAGSVIGIDKNSLTGPHVIKTVLIFEPTNVCVVHEVQTFQHFILIEILNNVNGEVHRFEWKGDQWVSSLLPLPKLGQLKIIADCLISYENFITPYTLYYYDSEKNTVELLKTSSAQFDATNLQVSQYKTISKDGIGIPYYVVHAKTMQFDSANATLLYGYGGFEVAKLPEYLHSTGKIWLNEGGVYVLANIRGGGEFGPKWHEAAIKENRHKAFEDFKAVATDLVSKNFTSPARLGILGGSNGGLLVGVALTQWPELFKAVVCRSPLLDMLHHSGFQQDAETSTQRWVNEYGDPNEEKMAQYIKSYSPYHNVSKDKHYPSTLFFSSSNDDVAPPGHARKMANKMQEMGHEIYYYESAEGGHGCKGHFPQTVFREALIFSFLQHKLMDKPINSIEDGNDPRSSPGHPDLVNYRDNL